MQFSKMLFNLSAMALAAAAPTSDQSSALDARAFQSPFTSHWSIHALCEPMGFEPVGGDYSDTSDCQALADYWRSRPGYWHILSWDGTAASTLVYEGSCFVRISNPDGQHRVLIGSEDIANFLDEAVKEAQSGDGITIGDGADDEGRRALEIS
ncbi:hypothetical protein G7054_g7246 [Neopestalotiopsis clavispora]|nr:hypothetical protein G7054_g7246 [Neopestalotiopsis clavispora]